MLKKWIVSVMSVAVVGFGGMSAVHADHSGTKNCGDFNTGEEVWEFWEEHGYYSDNDPSGLDGDSDGVPCETLTMPDYEDQFLAHESDMQNGESTEAVEEEPEVEEETENNNGNNNNNENNHNNENANNNNHNNSDNNNAEDVNNEDDANEEAAAENNHNDEGNEMAATSTANPMLVLFGVIFAGLGAMMMIRRKTAEA